MQGTRFALPQPSRRWEWLLLAGRRSLGSERRAVAHLVPLRPLPRGAVAAQQDGKGHLIRLQQPAKQLLKHAAAAQGPGHGAGARLSNAAVPCKACALKPAASLGCMQPACSSLGAGEGAPESSGAVATSSRDPHECPHPPGACAHKTSLARRQRGRAAHLRAISILPLRAHASSSVVAASVSGCTRG